MLRILFIIHIFLLSLSLKGQTFLADPISGKPYMLKTYDDIRGSAFLFEDWKISNITDKKGIVFSGIMIRFDLYVNNFFYKHGDTIYEFITDIAAVELFPFNGDTLTKMIFKKGFTLGEKVSPDKYIQVLNMGKVTVVKYLFKNLEEVQEYNVAGKVKNFSSQMNYYFIKEGIVISQRPGAKLLQELLKDKWTAVESWMKQNSLSPKNEDDCIKIINYYNNL